MPALAVRTRGSDESPFTWSPLVLRLALTLAIVCCGVSTVCLPRVASAGIEMPIGETAAPVKIRGDSATNMTQGQYQVWIVRGNVELKQDDVVASADEAVFWVDRAEAFSGRPSKVIGYFEGNVKVNFGRRGNPHLVTGVAANTLEDKIWLGRFHTTGGIELQAPIMPGEPNVEPAIFRRGLEARDPFRQTPEGNPIPTAISDGAGEGVQQAQAIRQEVAPPTRATVAPAAGRRVRVFPRSGSRWNARTIAVPERNEQVLMATSGMQIVIDGIEQLGTVSIETDRLVAWIPPINVSNPEGGQTFNTDDGPIEFYLEGNIVFRQGDRVIYADRMYYNARQEYGVVLNAELLTPVPEYQGLVRLRAEVLQQVSAQQYQAYNAAVTSSRIGVPRYWFQTGDVSVTDTPTPLVDPFTGQPLIDPATGEQQVEHKYLATANDNRVYIGGVPVFYWPTIATDLTKPTFYVDSIRFNSDRIFGQQVYVDIDLYQVFGIRNPPPNTRWTLSTDYLSERGAALGTNYRYAGDTLLGFPGPYQGFIDAWGLPYDSGLDTLGADRMNMVPESRNRGRLLAQHRQLIGADWQFTGEVGLISDRNFLEMFYETEWDTFKDESTGVELKRFNENRSWSLSSDVRVNDFFTDTTWLPRLDHFTIGQSLLFDRLTWHEHTSIGYADLGVATTPTAPQDAATFQLLPWERHRQGLRAITRQELDMPLEAGPVKVVPYVLGEAGFWGEVLNEEELSRFYGQGGIRASLPVWSVDPTVKSELFNLNGMAHKITYKVDAFYAAADQDVTEFPLYDQLDDNAQESFRRRMLFNTFGLTFGDQIPLKYDERLFAVRSNMQGWVTGQSMEIADDMTQVRFGVDQRWQTKRGLAGQERIIDWITLDVEAVFFPDPERDNFGENFGMFDYEFRWHIGDRLTLLSDGYADFFSQGLRQVTVGGIINRPENGSLFLGFRSTEGPISSNVLVAAANYRLSEKWIANAGTSIDFSSTGNIGQNVGLVRIGESFLMNFGFNYDASRDNYGFQFGLEPRFLPTSRLGLVGGVQVPPAGVMGLE